MPHPLIRALRRELAAHANPAKAASMQAYMKSAMPFYGVQNPTHRRLCRRAFDKDPLSGRRATRDPS